MIQMMRGKLEPKMPPDGEPRPGLDEVQLIVDWIENGAPGPDGTEQIPTELRVPQIESSITRIPITALAFSPNGSRLAIGRFGSIEIRNLEGSDGGKQSVKFDDLPGKVTSLQFSADGRRLYVATGVSGLYGEAIEITIASGKRRHFRGHRDLAYGLSLNQDETLLATVGYDKKAIIWELTAPTSNERPTDGAAEQHRTATESPPPKKKIELVGHNGAIFDTKFDPRSQTLVTASADATVKVWRISDGQRMDTRGEPLQDQYTVDISPDGNWIVAGGEDHRIRKWKLESRETAKINPLMISRFAHESAIQLLRYHPDGNWIVSSSKDRTLKIWDAHSLDEAHLFPNQPADVQALALTHSRIAVGRMDGSLAFYRWPQLQSPTSSTGHPISTERPPNQFSDGPTAIAKIAEEEPNDRLPEARTGNVPFELTGKIYAGDRVDVDLVKFSATAGQQFMIEVRAATNQSPLDSHIAILADDGRPVPRVLLQAVRDSYFTFRGKNSKQTNDFRIHNWEEMQIGQLLYCNGEVVRLYHYPRGPDSGFNVFPNFGNRQTLFDTTPIAHALNEPCYVVEAFAPDTDVVESGLPSFLVNYENDDDAEQELGRDSRLQFTAPADGDYFVRIKDARGFGGEDFAYQLTVRSRQPNFSIARLPGINPKLAKGTYKKFGIEIDRVDGFAGPVDIRVEGLPDGFQVVGDTTVEAGQLRAWMVLHATETAIEPPEKSPQPTVVATARIGDQNVRRTKSLGKISLEPEVQLRVGLSGNVAAEGELPVIEIRPGSTTSAQLKVERIKHNARINFGKEDAGINFPFGVYVDNIGLNGVLIPPGESERTIFLTAESFVQPCERLVFLEAEEAGKPSSNPVILRVIE